MKTNLDKIFKNDEKLEESGLWMDLSEETGFLVARFGGYNSTKVKAALAKYYKPFARQVEAGTLSTEKEREILVKLFVDSCLYGWRGVEIDGAKVEFSKEAAVKLLMKLPELHQTLVDYASDTKNYREEVGNS